MATIIIEGCDGSGKSTLISHMRQLSNYPLCFVNRVNAHQHDSQPKEFCHWILSKTRNFSIVVDRFPLISEKIYGPILRGVDRFEKMNRAEVIEWLRWRDDVRVIYCRPQRARISTNVEKSNQLSGAAENLNTILGMYDAWMYAFRQAGLWVRDYDYEVNSAEQILKECFKQELLNDTGSDRQDLQQTTDASQTVQSD
jgi:hypothetical protein